MFGYATIHTPSPEEEEVKQAQISAVFEVLEDWFLALEDGSASHRLPDPSFEQPQGRPQITEELANEFIKELDREIDIDAFGYQGQKYKADATSEFLRLEMPQRIALVQALMRVLVTDEEMAAKVKELRIERGGAEEASDAAPDQIPLQEAA